jgi:hypothetical protein
MKINQPELCFCFIQYPSYLCHFFQIFKGSMKENHYRPVIINGMEIIQYFIRLVINTILTEFLYS